MRKRQQIITTIVMGSAVAALSVNVANATPAANTVTKAPSGDLLAQIPPAPSPNQQPLVANPQITIDGVPPIPGVGLLTPMMPRAVAPPVGDISVSNIDASIPLINLDSGVKINMVLKNAPAREVLSSLARSANLNLAYSNNNPALGADGKPFVDPIITIDLRNESVQNAFNYVLQMSGLEGSRVGNTLFVGAKLPDSLQETVVRTLRMNQISAESAASFLATQGAEARITTFTERYDVVRADSGVGNAKAAGADSVLGNVVSYTTRTRVANVIPLTVDMSKTTSPVVLRGLSVSTDERLNSVTLVGTPRKVEMASAILSRLDARRRQVALNVKIVDVNLSNANSISNSLSFKAGDGFLSVDGGAAVYNYGGYNPPKNSAVLNSVTTPPVVALNLPGGGTPFLDYSPNANFSNQNTGNAAGLGNITRPNFGSSSNPYQPGVVAFDPGTPSTPGSTTTTIDPTTGRSTTVTGIPTRGTPDTYRYAVPNNFQYPTKFLSTLQAQIISGNGKILTDPTLVVQEGQKSTINLTQQVFGGFRTISVAGTGSTNTTREPIIKEAGLSVDLTINRIDDNGYVSVAVSPTVSSIGSTVTTPDGEIALLQSRTMNSGEIRLRDGQTLILSGIIQESDRTSVSKVPILGDIPILGALFRSTNKTNQRQEVVVLLTPQILDDSKSQVNYTPGVDARLLIGK